MTELKYRLLVILSSAWRRRYTIALPILLMPLVGAVVSHLSPSKYVSHTSMLIQETAKMNPFLEDIAVSTRFKERINALRTLLKSRHVLHSVAQEQGLINDQMSSIEAERVIQKLSASLSVNQLGKEFVQIKLQSKHKEGMKTLLESVSNHFIEQLLAPERSSIKDSSEFLTIHINKRLSELNQAEQALADYQNSNPNMTPDMQRESLNRLASLKQTLAEKEARLSGVRKSLGSLDQQLSKTNPVVGKIEEKIIDVHSELTLLRAKYTNNHSAVEEKRQELERLETERSALLSNTAPELSSDQLWDIASSVSLSDLNNVQPLLITQLQSLQAARSEYEALSEETKSLQKMVRQLEQQAQFFGDEVKILDSLNRKVNLKRRLYDELVERYEMAQLTGSLGIFEQNKRVKIIDLPFTPSAPVNFPMPIYIIAGLFAGIALGCGLATLLELFDTSVRRKAELEQITGAPVLTVIPKITP
ncbi:GumC family protein [Vibrio sp. SCSIO 43137]|uniref:GumC family protein n=1 Tax=Vibrio sp. SCSIO 43137 TaxID=3021011 RepID=UPI00230807E9|nr:chain-length determining protein [Vibrio sp. SCSIO 43137]WCE31973.1 chain-length determining protein [Vibrio sp. SCSIO 43137]